MGFLRVKKIKGKEYVYVAESKWMKKTNTVRQISKKYLGRLFRSSVVLQVDFFDFFDIQDKELYFENHYRQDLIYDVVRWELYRHGFREVRNIWRKDDLYVNLRLKHVLCGRGKAALGMHEGYLTGYTLSRLIRYKAYVQEDGYALAKLFVEAGINIPQEVFVAVFSKYSISAFE